MTPPTLDSSSRRERKSAELRDRLFRAALQLFARKGYVETTVEDITNAADVGKGTFFNYFPSKEHILAGFGQMQFAKVQAAADAAETTKLPIREFLKNLALEVNSEPVRTPEVVRAVLQANLSSEPVREMMRKFHARASLLLAKIIEVGQRRGEIRTDLEPIVIAQTIRQSLLGAMLIWSLYGDGTLASRVEKVLDVIWHGLAAKQEPARVAPHRGEGKLQ